MLYNFTEISAFDILGDYELFTEHSSRIITLKTLSTTHCLTIPANAYLDWIRKDANALFLRIQILLKQIIGQTTFDRKNFFLNNKDRFLLFLYREYIRQAKNTITIKLTHDEIANYLGCSTRTVNRIIRNLNDEHYLKLSHGKILISKDQFQRIKLVVQSELLKDF
jgi:CRP/FNR family cyclic AMP-dependent transcriptional regulator